MKTRTLEDYADRIEYPSNLAFALLAFRYRIVTHLLKYFKCMIAIVASVTVSRHYKFTSDYIAN